MWRPVQPQLWDEDTQGEARLPLTGRSEHSLSLLTAAHWLLPNPQLLLPRDLANGENHGGDSCPLVLRQVL